MHCPACGTRSSQTAKYCSECGAALARSCTACASSLGPDAKFCSECGARVGEPAPAPPPSTEAPISERRLVSVLFADLAGYTALSEGRDFEDVRELQSHYFDVARTVIGRYGGTVEKFIGDAVMALWGAPVAREDDAERAVRAALDLVDAVAALAADPVGADLRLRAAVHTGEAAVTIGAEGQGMVTGDLVNTASRIQGAAEPGTVLVGDATRRATDATIAYSDAGEHRLKGKSEPVRVWRALHVTGQRRGEGRAAGLDIPFVGRAAELRLVKDLFHATADESRARLVSVLGVAGIGKSRLSWEFEKHVEGLVADVWWHRGRCLSYGEGVAYWALAEMVRGRAQILEDEDAAAAAAKLDATLVTHVPEPEERSWIAPRVLHLLGLAERSAPDREDLFAAWRRFFERLAEQGPLVMIFEDIHWADEGLIAFIEYLLDWSRHLPIFVMTLARPELADRHPGFPGLTRSSTTLPLAPLSDGAMDELLDGLVPGLPPGLRDHLRHAADGVPLYAVETVRMLRDRGVIEQAGGETALVGDLSAFEVPETLHALIASRLDALPDAERRLLQDAAVMGKTFTRRGLTALSGLPDVEVEALVQGLVRRELLAVQADPFSPERGQLGFLQALVQRVTYETISRRDRKRRHLAVARYLSSDAGVDADEIAEVIATHYLDAHEADPDATDSDDVRIEARAWFTRAAERAASLAASHEAQRAFERAAALASEPVERGRSLARAGELAVMGGRLEEAQSLLEEAIGILDGVGQHVDAARAEVGLGEVLFLTNRIEEAVARLESALGAHDTVGDEVAVATVSAQLARFLFFEGRPDDALPHVERALELGERLRLADVVVEALNNKALIVQRRPNESIGLMRQALALALESGVDFGAIRACMNLSHLLALAARHEEADAVVEHGLGIARRRGDRLWEQSLMTNLVGGRITRGRWDDAERLFEEIPPDLSVGGNPVAASLPLGIAAIAMYRGDDSRAVALASEFATWRDTAYVQVLGVGFWARALTACAERRFGDAVTECIEGLRHRELRLDPVGAETLLELGGEAALVVESTEASEELLELAVGAPIDQSVSLSSRIALQQARVAALKHEREPPFAHAVAAFRTSGEPFWVATALLEQAEWLAGKQRFEEAEPLLAEAREVFERLRAAPRLERVERVERVVGSISRA